MLTPYFCYVILSREKGGVFLLLLEVQDLVKYFGDRLILKIDELKVYDNDRIGIVGLNGSGKTTLLNILSGKTGSDAGWVKSHGPLAYIEQLEAEGLNRWEVDEALAGKFGLPDIYRESLSGGEKTKYKIAAALSKKSSLLLADEPTANLDMDGIKLLEEELRKYDGALLLVSHDRELLDNLCNKILELEEGQVKLYNGNYSDYLEQKSLERQRHEFEYQQYRREKARLTAALREKREQSRAVRKAPKRMGNSEARLHKMGYQKAKKNLDKAAKAIETRIRQLEPKEKPKDIQALKLDLRVEDNLHAKVILEGKDLNKSFGSRVIFHNASFQLENGTRTALVGPNGSGKTTLLKMIIAGEPGIKTAHNLRIGYFSQELDILDEERSILDNLLELNSDETMVRTLLARLLFRRDEVYKKVSMLSGGERVRASLGKIIVSDYNLLILDEPTNYLDIFSMEAMESVLAEYPGNLLFVSHDRRFINNVANNLLLLRDKRIVQFPGNLDQYRQHLEQKQQPSTEEERLVLELRLNELVAKLSLPDKTGDVEALDREYRHILKQLKGK
ncbi:MAG: ABC-F type ribosomal protection protein [Clostridia bacterium]|nr:ABC-F type ribosomal protection protein [Clostridia bacterium]